LIGGSLWLTQPEDDNCSISETSGNINFPVQPISLSNLLIILILVDKEMKINVTSQTQSNA
jgi:hypothetical protein